MALSEEFQADRLPVSRLRQIAGLPASIAGDGRRWTLAALALAVLAGLPIAAIVWAALVGESRDASGGAAIGALAQTVLPMYIANTGLLMVLTGAIAGVTGTGCAWLVAATRFPGRRILSWALVLPLALPAYLSAYIYAGMLDFAGPVQSALRGWGGWSAGEYWFPDIRSLPGGAFVLGFAVSTALNCGGAPHL